MNILILEDEIYNFRLLRHQLLDINPDYDVVGPISTVEEGRAYLAFHPDIDLIIADIQLNDGLSFDVLSFISPDIPVIFTTAYDEYALKAFEYNSLSYLLKPIGEEELRQALRKALRLSGKKEPGSREARANAKNSKLPGSQSPETQTFLVKTPRGERRVHISMVRYAASEDKTTYIYLLDGTSYTIDIALSQLASQLDTTRFMRVNRKYILPLEQVKGFENLSNGRMRLILYGLDSPEIDVSRAMRKKVKAWIKG